MSYEHLNNPESLGIPTWAPAMMGFGQDHGEVSAQSIEPAPEVSSKPIVPEEPVVIPTIDDPWAVLSKKEIALLSNQELTEQLNEEIAESWRLKGCAGPYCYVQAERNQVIRTALIAEYRRRQMDREMPALKEPVHTLAYGRYKLSRAIIQWTNRTLTSRILWPARVYMKASATAIEDAVASKYLMVFIISSPLVGAYAAKKLGYTGIGSMAVGGYLGMVAGALLPMALYSAAQALGAAEEKDFLWAVS